ncbi:putative serine esterase-domain-containing protein [Tirmania nivea]|nr:putative serine esterase-domain-containing protein [Tirmania nivea]
MAVDTPGEGGHLCILVHGLWGNPTHLEYLSLALRSRYPHVRQLICKRNSGNFTYDGIETGGERVTKEIESALEEYSQNGVTINKLSIVGYSLGGLVSRYAIGLLYSRGWFKKLQPVNFTTFATPHLGVRTPLLGWHNHLWNVLGARVLSASGRQLFLIDDFRNTGRPLLSILADKDSIFYKGLSKFPRKVLYANIVNDRVTCFYTSGISRTDPFADLSTISVNYVPGYEPVVLDPATPISPLDEAGRLPPRHGISIASHAFVKKLPRILLYFLFIPIVITGFLLNALFQTVTSWRRIRLHESKDGEREGYHYYRRLPLMLVEEMQDAVEGVIEDIHQMQDPEYLPSGMEESIYYGQPISRSVCSAPLLGTMKGSISNSIPITSSSKQTPKKSTSIPSSIDNVSGNSSGLATPASDSEYEQVPSIHPSQICESDEDDEDQEDGKATENQAFLGNNNLSRDDADKLHNLEGNSLLPLNYGTTSPERMECPTLALTQSQFEMIQNMDTLGFHKLPVWIHNDAHSHAAIIVRRPWKKSWAEGKVVVRHWVEEMFLA